MADAELFRANLKALASAQGFTPYTLAKSMGLHPSMVDSWWPSEGKEDAEKAGRVPNGVYTCWIMQILGVGPVQLVGRFSPKGDEGLLEGSEDDLLERHRLIERG